MKNVLKTVTNKVKTSKLGLYASGALMGLASLAPVMADGTGGSVSQLMTLLCKVAGLGAWASAAIVFAFAMIELGNAKAENSPAAKHTAQMKFVAVVMLGAIGALLEVPGTASALSNLIPTISV